MQHLKQSDIESRLTFAQWIREHDNIVNDIWFSDEAHFYLNGIVNKRNSRYWGSEIPNLYLEKPVHGEKITVWAAMSSKGIIGPFFFENETSKTQTVNSTRYLELLKKKFLPCLVRSGFNPKDIWLLRLTQLEMLLTGYMKHSMEILSLSKLHTFGPLIPPIYM
jgi:hypothetical protein